MNEAVEQLQTVREAIVAATAEAKRERGAVTLVAVSKTFEPADILPVIEAGQRVFGENRVQEAQGKWPALKQGISRHRAAFDRPAAVRQGERGGRAVRSASKPSTGKRSRHELAKE